LWTKAWPSLGIVNSKRSIDEARKLVREPQSGQADEVTRALARFLVVRSTGYLEQVVIESCTAYISSKSEPRVGAFAAGFFDRYLNPKPARLLEIVRSFDPEWEDQLTELFDDGDELLRREVALLVDRRNKIAHGLGEGITSLKALGLLDAAEKVADWFVERFDPR